MLVYEKVLNLDYFNLFDSNYALELSIKEYRKRFLNSKSRKQCYLKAGLEKDTPAFIEKIIIAFDRKIENLCIFRKSIKAQYFKGINKIYQEYYKALSKEQKPSKKYKKIEKIAQDYINSRYDKIKFRDWKR